MMSFSRPVSFPILLAIACGCISCSDDPKLVEKREKQKLEIARLTGELALVTEKLKNVPPDVAGQLAEARKLSEKQSAEVALLETEVAALEAKKRALKSEFEAYQVKYQVK